MVLVAAAAQGRLAETAGLQVVRAELERRLALADLPSLTLAAAAAGRGLTEQRRALAALAAVATAL
jgi:hypothetical protein